MQYAVTLCPGTKSTTDKSYKGVLYPVGNAEEAVTPTLVKALEHEGHHQKHQVQVLHAA